MPKSPATLKAQYSDTDGFDQNTDLVNQLACHDLGTLGDTDAATIEAAYVIAAGGASVAGSLARFISTNPYITVARGGGNWDSVQLTAAG